MTSQQTAAKETEIVRCGWVNSDPLYIDYHDNEWGHRVTGDNAVFERLSLEAFQSGLSWLTILRKRENFREAFHGFDISEVATFDEHDYERLMQDAGIVRNRLKIRAVINNARAAQQLDTGLSQLVWEHSPSNHQQPASLAEIASTTPESRALAKSLKAHGFSFIGPTTAYAAMQAIGVVNDHTLDCSFGSPNHVR